MFKKRPLNVRLAIAAQYMLDVSMSEPQPALDATRCSNKTSELTPPQPKITRPVLCSKTSTCSQSSGKQPRLSREAERLTRSFRQFTSAGATASQSCRKHQLDSSP